ncbi:MAG: LLM class flavin-dependent oxidoreductase [Hyphomicrobiales bacterium]
MNRYRQGFQPSPFLDAPRASVGVSVTCAETDEEAEWLAWSRWAARIAAGRSGRRGILSPEEAMALDYSEAELDYIAYQRRTSIWGSPGHVRDRLEELARTYSAEELVVVTITHSFAARKRSYELLAKEFGLDAA